MAGSEPTTKIDTTAEANMTTESLSNPLPDPATTIRLVLGAIAMQAGTQALTKLVDRAVLGVSETSAAPKTAAKPAGKVKTLTSKKLAAIATKSIPGAAVVTGGLLMKYVFDRGGVRKQAARDAAKAPALPTDQK